MQRCLASSQLRAHVIYLFFPSFSLPSLPSLYLFPLSSEPCFSFLLFFPRFLCVCTCVYVPVCICVYVCLYVTGLWNWLGRMYDDGNFKAGLMLHCIVERWRSGIEKAAI